MRPAPAWRSSKRRVPDPRRGATPLVTSHARTRSPPAAWKAALASASRLRSSSKTSWKYGSRASGRSHGSHRMTRGERERVGHSKKRRLLPPPPAPPRSRSPVGEAAVRECLPSTRRIPVVAMGWPSLYSSPTAQTLDRQRGVSGVPRGHFQANARVQCGIQDTPPPQ